MKKKCVIVQHEAVHEEIGSTFIYLLNKLGYEVIYYLNERIREKRGDIFNEFNYFYVNINYIPLNEKSDWLNLSKEIEELKANLVVSTTFQREGVADWYLKLGVPIMGVVHNVNMFLKNGIDNKLINSEVPFHLFTLAKHVSSSLIKQTKIITEESISTVYPIIWPNKESVVDFKNWKIVIPGGVSFENRDYLCLVDYFKKHNSSITVSILGGGKDRNLLEKIVKEEHLIKNFEFLPRAESGYVQYKEYVQALHTSHFIDPLFYEATKYHSNKISSVIPTAIGFKKPIYLSKSDYDIYNIISTDFRKTRTEFMNNIEKITVDEYNHQQELMECNFKLFKQFIEDEFKYALKVLISKSKGNI